jgi:hypothetical protein
MMWVKREDSSYGIRERLCGSGVETMSTASNAYGLTTSSSSSEPSATEYVVHETECYCRNAQRLSVAEHLVQRSNSLAQVAATIHKHWGATAVACTTNTMLVLLSIAPHVLLLPFAIKLSELSLDLRSAASVEDEIEIVRRRVAALGVDDRMLVILAASRVGNDSLVFHVLLTAVTKRLLVCDESVSQLSLTDRRKVLSFVETFIGRAEDVLAEWQSDWVELVASFPGCRSEALKLFLVLESL